MKSTPNDKAFNATPAGQRAMCRDADTRSVAFLLNNKVKQLGGAGWDAAWIANANPSTLASIKDDLLAEYNSLVTKPGMLPTT